MDGCDWSPQAVWCLLPAVQATPRLRYRSVLLYWDTMPGDLCVDRGLDEKREVLAAVGTWGLTARIATPYTYNLGICPALLNVHALKPFSTSLILAHHSPKCRMSSASRFTQFPL